MRCAATLIQRRGPLPTLRRRSASDPLRTLSQPPSGVCCWMDTSVIVRGSCLCGSVTYEASKPFEMFVNCHCSRCRKASGTAHTTNAVVRPGAFRWTQGQDRVVRFDLTTARSFATSFCEVCGAPLPHFTRSGRQVIIPGGSFDDDPDVFPTLHECWASRASWYRHGNEIPTDENHGANVG